MQPYQIHKMMRQIISLFYRIGFWHRGSEASVGELLIKLFYCIYQFLFVISLVVGAIINEKESILLVEGLIIVALLSFKMWFIIWKQKQIVELLNRICVFSIRNDDDFTFVNKKLGKFIKFVIVLVFACIFGILLEVTVIPFVGSEKTLFLKIGFPWDWKNNEAAFWAANAFLFTELMLSMTAVPFSITIWYLMLICSLRYEVLASDLRSMGQTNEKLSEKENQNVFLYNLKTSMVAHLQLREYSYVKSDPALRFYI